MTIDPSAATAVPESRAKLPADVQRDRSWVRVGVRRAEEVAPEHLDMELMPEGEEPPREPDVAAALAEVLQPMEEGPTDHGAPPVASEERPYTNLDYEERVCRLLEDIRENTRRVHLHLAAEEHRRHESEREQLVGGHLREERRTLLRWVEHWCLDPKLKSMVVKALAVGTALGTSIVGSAETMALMMELVERLLRAWVSLP